MGRTTKRGGGIKPTESLKNTFILSSIKLTKKIKQNWTTNGEGGTLIGSTIKKMLFFLSLTAVASRLLASLSPISEMAWLCGPEK